MKHLIYHSNNLDPAMRYESLAKFALGKDHELAKARVFEIDLFPQPTFKGVAILQEVIDGLIKIETANNEFRAIRKFTERTISEKTTVGLIDHLINIIEN